MSARPSTGFAAMPAAARAYLLAVVVAAVAASGAALALSDQAPTAHPLAFALLAAAAAAAHLFVVHTKRNHSYHTTMAFVVPAALLLAPPLLVALVVVQHVPEYLRQRYPWYIAAFNVANYALDVFAAWAVFRLLAGSSTPRWAAAAFAAALVLVIANHLLLAVMLKLGRGHALRDSALFSIDALATDLAAATLGVAIAWFAIDNPWLLAAAVLPLLFLYRALRVPVLHEAEAVQSARAERHSRLTRLGLRAMSGAPADVVIDEAMAIIRDTLDMPVGYLLECVHDASQGEAFTRTALGCPSAAGRTRPTGQDLVALGAGEPVVVADYATETRFGAAPCAAVAGARSGVSIAVPGAHAPAGVLSAFAQAPRTYSSEEIECLQAVATTISVLLERERSRRALDRSERQREDLLDQMLRAEQETRLRIAQELHDDTIQVMAATLLNLDLVKGRIARVETDAALKGLARARTTLDAAIERTRTLTFELRPPLLERNGLGSALTELAEQVGREAGFDAAVAADVGRYAQTIEDLAYRTMQEAIANVRKHARATHVAVELHERDGRLEGRVVDDGCGFDVESALDRSRMRLHLGLDALIERVQLAGGAVQLASQPGQGSTLTFSLPVAAGRPRAAGVGEQAPRALVPAA